MSDEQTIPSQVPELPKPRPARQRFLEALAEIVDARVRAAKRSKTQLGSSAAPKKPSKPKRQPNSPPSPQQQLQQSRGLVKMLLEYFQSDFAREAETPIARTLDMCRAFAAVDLRFPEPQYVEQAIREMKVAESVARDPSLNNKRHLADLHGLSIKDITRIGKQKRAA